MHSLSVDPITIARSSALGETRTDRASKRFARIYNSWLCNPAIGLEALRVVIFMLAHPGWVLRRAHICRPRAEGGPGWEPTKYIDVRDELIAAGVLDTKTRKLLAPTTGDMSWTPIPYSSAAAILVAKPREAKATVIELFCDRFRQAPARREIQARFGVSDTTLQRIGLTNVPRARRRSKSNGMATNPNAPKQSKANGVSQTIPNGKVRQKLTDTVDEYFTLKEETKDGLRTLHLPNQHQHHGVVVARDDDVRGVAIRESFEKPVIPDADFEIYRRCIQQIEDDLGPVNTFDRRFEFLETIAALPVVSTTRPDIRLAITKAFANKDWINAQNAIGLAIWTVRSVIQSHGGPLPDLPARVPQAEKFGAECRKRTLEEAGENWVRVMAAVYEKEFAAADLAPVVAAASEEGLALEYLTSPTVLRWYDQLLAAMRLNDRIDFDANKSRLQRIAAFPFLATRNWSTLTALARKFSEVDWSEKESPEGYAIVIVDNFIADHEPSRDPSATKFRPNKRHVRAMVDAWEKWLANQPPSVKTEVTTEDWGRSLGNQSQSPSAGTQVTADRESQSKQRAAAVVPTGEVSGGAPTGVSPPDQYVVGQWASLYLTRYRDDVLRQYAPLVAAGIGRPLAAELALTAVRSGVDFRRVASRLSKHGSDRTALWKNAKRLKPTAKRFLTRIEEREAIAIHLDQIAVAESDPGVSEPSSCATHAAAL